MTFRRMKVIFRRTILGNIAALCFVASIVVLYLCLLRYNTANTHFDIRSHDIKKRYIRGEPLQIKVPWKKLLHSNVYKGKGGNWSRRTGPNTPLSLFVVEEHHEVIPYWFDAANAKAISHHGNTLIHIDGHDDMAPPAHFPDYPTFRWPKTKQDFKLLMQRNDVFIIEAIISGLIKRVIWIWPEWDKKNHNSSYSVQHNQIGIANVKRRDNTQYEVFCICEFQQKSSLYNCYYPDYESDNATAISIPKNKCRVQRTYTVEEIQENVAVKYVNNAKWLLNNEEIILDLDEDYYGCVYASQPLLDLGVKEVELKHINNYLDKLICPKSLAQERYVDNILTTALDLFKRFYTCQNPKQPVAINKNCPKLAKITSEVNAYLQKILWQNKKIHLCSKQHHAVKYAISEIIHSFQKLGIKQLKAMQRVGFCLNTSPKTYKVTFPPRYGICMGANTPSDSSVLIHNPTRKEITERTATLQNILKSLKAKSVKFVTICRSSRDGYTPRRFFKLIESDIMASLNKTFNNNCVAHYDGGLLGGIKGWISRPKIVIKH